MLRFLPLLVLVAVWACGSDGGVGPTSGPRPASLSAVSGLAQVGWPGQPLPSQLVVEATDTAGAPVSGVVVTWSVTAGGGSLSTTTLNTGADGRATTEWTLGTTATEQSVEARVAGGLSTTFDAELRATGQWERVTDMLVPVRAAAVATDGSRIFVFGGEGMDSTVATTQVFDPETGTWSLGAPIPTEVVWSTAVFDRGRIHLFGGVTNDEAATDAHWIYTVASDTWAAGVPLPAPAAGAASGRVRGKMVVAGGIDGPGAYSDNVHVYDPVGVAWTSGAPAPGPWINWQAATVGGRLIVSGGSGPGRFTSRLVSEYDVIANTWSSLEPLPVRTEAHAASTAGGLYCILGGRVTPGEGSYNTPRDRVDCFSREGELWFDGPDLPIRLQESGAVEVAGHLYVMGGWLGPVEASDDVFRLEIPGS